MPFFRFPFFPCSIATRSVSCNSVGDAGVTLETVGSVVASQSPGLGPALLVNSSVFLFGMPVLLKGLTGIATANAWFLGTVRFWGIVLYAREERESDDLKAQILLTCYVLKQPRDVPTLARRPRVRERLYGDATIRRRLPKPFVFNLILSSFLFSRVLCTYSAYMSYVLFFSYRLSLRRLAFEATFSSVSTSSSAPP